ncbi:MAG: hypothetical protein QW153_03360 [Candidatus Bilamarchaeaceae archaeon]
MGLEEELLKIMTKEELQKEVARTIGDFHGFLTKQAALKVIAAEKGLIKKEIKSINSIAPNSKNINLSCIVVSVGQLKKYPSGTSSRIVSIKDESGSAQLLLWNDDAEEAAGLKAGDRIEIVNAYEKDGKINLGYAGYYKIVEKASFSPLADVFSHDGERLHFRNFISDVKKESTPKYFTISDGVENIICILESFPERIEKLASGREVVIENGLIKDGNIIIDSQSRLLVKKENVVAGVLDNMEPYDNGIALTISGKRIVLQRSRAFEFLGVKEVPGLSLSTIINLKKNMFIGRNVVVETNGG